MGHSRHVSQGCAKNSKCKNCEIFYLQRVALSDIC